MKCPKYKRRVIKNNHRRYIFFVFAFLSIFCIKTISEENTVIIQSNYAREECLPMWVWEVYQSKGLDKKYTISYHLNPFYQRGDFDGDKIQDIAVSIKNKTSNKYGIMIIHKKTKQIFVLGAGKAIGNGGDNFDWMDAWNVYDKGKVHLGVGETTVPVLKGDALDVIKN
jgi:hypothetical protein